MNFWDLLPTIIRYLQHRDESEEIAALLRPTLAELRKVLPQLIPAVRILLAEVAPDILAQFNLRGVSTYDSKAVQMALNELGAKLTVDGYPGKETAAEISKFQAGAGLPVDGWAGVHTLMALGAALKQKETAK